MTSSDAGATSSSISSPIVPSSMPTLSNAPSLTLSPASTTSDNLTHRPFSCGMLRRIIRALEESITSLREQLATERLLRTEDKKRADLAEERGRELHEQLQAEIVEHRRVV